MSELMWFAGLAAIFSVPTIARLIGFDSEWITRKSRSMVSVRPPFDVSEAAQALHREAFIADLHGDSLLWRRDLSHRSRRGHLDVPRMIEGGIGLQLFLAVLDVPRDIFGDSIPRDSDQITRLAIVDGWPVKAWRSHFERARFLSQRLVALERKIPARFKLIRWREDLSDVLLSRRHNRYQTAGLLGLHDSIGSGWELSRLDALFALGYRSSVLCHYTDTPLAGSSQGVSKPGLSTLGGEFIRRMEDLGMTVDLTHSSFSAVEDAFGLVTRPVIFSHAGVSGVFPQPRNIPDSLLDLLKRNGGVIGIGFYPEVVPRGLEGIVRSILHVCERIGPEHAALGSGFDSTAVALDATGLVVLTDALLKAGLPPEAVVQVMGGNVSRVFAENLPPRPTGRPISNR